MNIERMAACALLDEGVSIPLRPIFGQPKRVTMRIPTTRDLIRISRMYIDMGIKYDNLKNFTMDEKVKFMAEHGKAVSRMLAYAVVRLPFLNGMVVRVTAAWLRARMHPVAMLEAWKLVLECLRINPFEHIIGSVEVMNCLAPAKSQQQSRS